MLSRQMARAALVLCFVAIAPGVLAQGGRGEQWVGTWATALVARAPQPEPAAAGTQGAAVLNFNGQTLRQIARTSIGGERVRVVLSNTFGTAPLAVGGAHIALRDKDAAIVPNSGRPLTFGGSASASIPPGAILVSDPVTLSVPALADVAIDIYLPGNTAAGSSPLTMHTGAWQTNYVSPAGNHAGAVTMPMQTTTASWFFLARVEVLAPDAAGAVVTFGDSITDGTASTPNTNNRWPNHLAKRLAARNIKMGVLNAGISGNRLLTGGAGINALARFDRDVLTQSGVTHVVVLEGINDIGLGPGSPVLTRARALTAADRSPAELIAAHQQLIARARARGLRIYGATLTPFEGARYWTPAGEAKRRAVNEWIRTSQAYDAVVDFDAALRDPAQPTKFLPKYDSGDHLHPSDAGYEAMAAAVDLELFKVAEGAAALRR